MQVPKAPDYDYWAEMLTNGENRQQLRNMLGVEAAAATAAKKEAAAKEEAAKGAKAPTMRSLDCSAMSDEVWNS